jgi:hypothetical protein
MQPLIARNKIFGENPARVFMILRLKRCEEK